MAEPLADDARRFKVSVDADAPFSLTIRRADQKQTYAVTNGHSEFLFRQE